MVESSAKTWVCEPAAEDLVRVNGLTIGIDGRELLRGQSTGTGRYLGNFLAYATSHFPNTQFFLYGNQDTRPEITAPNLHLRVAHERLTRWWDNVTLPRLLREDRADVLLSPYDKCPIRCGCPIVATVHDLLFLDISDKQGFHRIVYDACYRLERRLLLRNASKIVTVSQHSRRDIVSGLGIPNDRIVAVPNGLSADYRKPVNDHDATRTRQRLGINGPFILYVGNFKPHKNVGMLIEAFARIPSAVARTHRLVLCGKRDPFRDRLAARCEALAISSRIKWIDFVEEPDLPGLYQAADLFVFPSLYEGFGLPPLEAMASGTPVVSSGATSLSEVLGNAAIVVDATDPDDVMRGIVNGLDDPSLRALCVESGYRRAAQFTNARAAKTLLLVLAHAAGERRERFSRPPR